MTFYCLPVMCDMVSVRGIPRTQVTTSVLVSQADWRRVCRTNDRSQHACPHMSPALDVDHLPETHTRRLYCFHKSEGHACLMFALMHRIHLSQNTSKEATSTTKYNNTQSQTHTHTHMGIYLRFLTTSASPLLDCLAPFFARLSESAMREARCDVLLPASDV